MGAVRRRRARAGALKALVLRVLLVGVWATTWARAEAEPDAGSGAQITEGPLRVVVAGSRPFVVPGSEPPVGLSVDVFREAARRLRMDARLERSPSVEAALEAVRTGNADLAVGPLSITAERARRVQFTQPYYQSSLAILAPAGDSLLSKLKPFMTITFLAGSGGLVLVLALVGTLVWAAERKHNPHQFPHGPLRGIGNGVWMALVTMTTVGYGDRVPVTLAGRLVTGIWMLLSMIVASSLTAFMATALTLSQLDGPRISSASDLEGRRVAVVSGSTGEAFAQVQRGRVQSYADLESAIASVEASDAAALVFDRPILRYWLSQHPQSTLQISEASYQPEGYGFAVSKAGTVVRNELDVVLLRMAAEGRVETLAERWLRAR